MLKNSIYNLWECGYRQKIHKTCIDLIMRKTNHFRACCDLGCGNGAFLEKVVHTFKPEIAVGCDSVPHIDSDTFRFLQTDFNTQHMPFSEDQFDIVTSLNVIEHLYNPDHFIMEAHRIIRPGGYFVVGTNNISNWTNILSLIFGRQPNAIHASDYGDFDRLFQKDWIRTTPSPQHRRLFSMGSLKKVGLFHGFSKPIGKYCVFYPFTKSLEKIFEKIFPIYCAYIVVMLEKPMK